MRAFAKIKHGLTLMCVIFTVIISVMYAIGLLFSDSVSLFVPAPSKALLMLLFSGIVGFASLILPRDKASAARIAVHFIICFASFMLVFVVGGGFSITGDTVIVTTLLFVAVYTISMVIRGLICRRHRDESTDEEVYTSIFK